VEYYAWLGRACDPRAVGRRAEINAGKRAMQAHEARLARRLIDGLAALPGVTIRGLTGAGEMDERVSTVSLTAQGHAPEALARALGERNIFAWSGDNYAVDLIEHLGLGPEGVLRLGPVHYNTTQEIDAVIAAMDELLRPRAVKSRPAPLETRRAPA
jgi:selenocysteine lyase/cysteine desulfurase